MSDERRRRRAAIREAKKNPTATEIDEQLGAALNAYLIDDAYFAKQIALCKTLELEYPEDAKNGYELPLFNKNPITNEIEMHADSMHLFSEYQVVAALAKQAAEVPLGSDEHDILQFLIQIIYSEPEVSKYIINLTNIAAEKGKPIISVFEDNQDEIVEFFKKFTEKE